MPPRDFPDSESIKGKTSCDLWGTLCLSNDFPRLWELLSCEGQSIYVNSLGANQRCMHAEGSCANVAKKAAIAWADGIVNTK